MGTLRVQHYWQTGSDVRSDGPSLPLLLLLADAHLSALCLRAQYAMMSPVKTPLPAGSLEQIASAASR